MSMHTSLKAAKTAADNGQNYGEKGITTRRRPRKATVKVLGSSSSGNGYIISTDSEVLILECGLKFLEYAKKIDFKTQHIAGVLVSHKHKDHAKFLFDAQCHGLTVYSCKEVAQENAGVRALDPSKKYKIGGFTVIALPVPHNAENYAYAIYHEDIGCLVFATDCEDFSYNVKGCTTLMIEANYSEEIALEKSLDGEELHSRSGNHMEIQQTVEVVKRHYTRELKNVILIHLSSQLSDEREFKRRVSLACPMSEVYAADAGMEISVGQDEF